MLRTTLEQWHALQAVVEFGGYAQAAEALNRSQPSISYLVNKLQEQLGVEMLTLVGRKSVLTERGASLLARSRELLADAERLERMAKHLEKGWEAEVTLVVDAALPNEILVNSLAMFTELAPDTRLQLKEVVMSGAEDALHEHSADLVIGSKLPSGFLGDELLKVEFVAVAHIDHPLHHMSHALTTDDLVKEQQIVVRDSGKLQPRNDGWLGAPRRWTVTGMDMALTMVEAKLGFSWLPKDVVCPALVKGHLKILPLKEGSSRFVTLYTMLGHEEQVGPATQQLMEILKTQTRQWTEKKSA